MFGKLTRIVGVLLLIGLAYLLFWPVAIDPVAWDAPENQGYTGEYAANNDLSSLQRISLGNHSGPEDVAVGSNGLLYMPTHDGWIVTVDPINGTVTEFAETKGRVLGIEFGVDGMLYGADAYQGLLKIDPTGQVTVLTDKVEGGSPIRYADDLDVAANGSVYFTDASVKFGAKENGGTLPASLLDLMEHGPNGRVLKYDPTTQKTTTVADELSFANGLALTSDGRHMLVVETGTYSVLKIPVDGSAAPQTIVENLPGFPDNINRNADGTFWLGLVSPRSAPVDKMSSLPFLRKIIQRLPAFLRPKPQRYGFVIRIDETGNVLETLQDPSGRYALTTGAIEGAGNRLYISSLTEPDLGFVDR